MQLIKCVPRETSVPTVVNMIEKLDVVIRPELPLKMGLVGDRRRVIDVRELFTGAELAHFQAELDASEKKTPR